jgi:hypothetical protein
MHLAHNVRTLPSLAGVFGEKVLRGHKIRDLMTDER